MEYKWELQNGDVVTVIMPRLGRKVLRLNGAEVATFWRTAPPVFALTDGTSARLQWRVPFLGMPTPRLLVDHQPMRMTVAGKPHVCPQCAAPSKPWDHFCEACGAQLVSVTDQERLAHVSNAAGTIRVLAVLFALSGVIMYFVQKTTADQALANLEGMAAEAEYPELINGEMHTVGELRSMIAWEPTSTLVVNLLLAVLMLGLFFWSKRAPLAALITAAGTYASVMVFSAIADPTTLAQGVIIKIFVIGMLYRGIKAGLEARAPQA